MTKNLNQVRTLQSAFSDRNDRNNNEIFLIQKFFIKKSSCIEIIPV